MKIPNLGGNAMPWATVLLIAAALFGVPLLLDVGKAVRARGAPPTPQPDLTRSQRKENNAAAVRARAGLGNG